jgi:hypothetical protein
MRIPIWPGVRLSVWERQNPEAVQVRLHWYHKPFTVRRVLSKRGWMILLVRYDWRDRGRPEPEDRPTNAVAVPPEQRESNEAGALRLRAHP